MCAARIANRTLFELNHTRVTLCERRCPGAGTWARARCGEAHTYMREPARSIAPLAGSLNSGQKGPRGQCVLPTLHRNASHRTTSPHKHPRAQRESREPGVVRKSGVHYVMNAVQQRCGRDASYGVHAHSSQLASCPLASPCRIRWGATWVVQCVRSQIGQWLAVSAAPFLAPAQRCYHSVHALSPLSAQCAGRGAAAWRPCSTAHRGPFFADSPHIRRNAGPLSYGTGNVSVHRGPPGAPQFNLVYASDRHCWLTSSTPSPFTFSLPHSLTILTPSPFSLPGRA